MCRIENKNYIPGNLAARQVGELGMRVNDEMTDENARVSECGSDEKFCCTSFQCFNGFWYIEFPFIKVKREEKWLLDEVNIRA